MVFEKSHSLSYLWVFKHLLAPPGEALPTQSHLPTQSSYYTRTKNSIITSFSPPVFKDSIQLLLPLQKLCLTPSSPPTHPFTPQSMFPPSHRHSHDTHQQNELAFLPFASCSHSTMSIFLYILPFLSFYNF